MADELENDEAEEEVAAVVEIPKLRVQRVGKKFRIVYEETRNVAKFNSGKPLDNGGYTDQIKAYKRMSKVVGDQPQADHEAEGIGN